VTCVAVGGAVRSATRRAAGPAEGAEVDPRFQNLEAQRLQAERPDYGSIGYGGSQRGDLSNLHFSLEALRATGLPADHEAFAEGAGVPAAHAEPEERPTTSRARCRTRTAKGVMLEATLGDDGGAVLLPGQQAAGYVEAARRQVVPRSYGSMTYALLKSYTLAGRCRGDDPRVHPGRP
jgi:hypothetical protein